MLPGLIVSAIALAIVFSFVNLGAFWRALQTADYVFIAIGFGISVVWLMVRGLFWRTLLQRKASYRDVFLTLGEGYLLNNVLPFRLGEVARAMLLSRKSELSFWQVIPTIVIERALDVAFAAGLLLMTLPFVVGAAWGHTAALVAGAVVVAGLAFLYLLARQRERALQVFDWLAERIPILRRLGGNALPAFLNGLAILTDGRLFLTAILWEALDWFLAIGQYYLWIRAFFPQAQLLWGAFTVAVFSLGIAAPSSPGAVGVMELSVVGALSAFSPNSSAAFATAITAHIFSYILNGVIGSYGLAQDGESLTGLYRSARNMMKREQPTEKEDAATLSGEDTKLAPESEGQEYRVLPRAKGDEDV